MIVTINGEQISTAKGTVSISGSIGERSTCSFTIVDIDGSKHYERGMNVEVKNQDGLLEFAGIIDSSVEKSIAGVGLFHEVTCVDWHYLADKRIVARYYENMKTGKIVKNLVDDYLADEGVTYSTETVYKSIQQVKNVFKGSDTIRLNTDNTLELGKPAVEIVPTLSSSSELGITVTSKTESSEALSLGTSYRFFDGNNRTGLSMRTGSQIIVDLGEGNEQVVRKYSLIGTHINNVSWIKSYSIHAKLNENDSWVLLDSKSGLTNTDTPFNKEFEVNVDKNAYRYYRIAFTDIRDGGQADWATIYEFNLFKLDDSPIFYGETEFEIGLPSYPFNDGTIIEWEEELPTGTSISIYTSYDGGKTWDLVNKGYRIPSLIGGEDFTLNNKLKFKVVMTSSSGTNTPTLKTITIKHIKTVATLFEGVDMEEVVFNYIPISEALDSLASKTGYWWSIDSQKRLFFIERDSLKAPFIINNMSIIKDSLTVENGNNNYRNQQYIIGAKELTDVMAEDFRGDGIKTTFTTTYPVAKQPIVKINGNMVSVGIRGIDDVDEEGEENFVKHNFYWSKGSKEITQHRKFAEENALKTSDILTVEYQGEFDIIVVAKDLSKIEETKSIENSNTTGIVEAVQEDKGLSSRKSGVELANNQLQRYGLKGRKVKFTTWKRGLQAGQIVTIDFPQHNINNLQFLIDNVEISCIDEDEEYTVTASYNLSEGSWAKFFYNLVTANRTYTIRENIGDGEVLTMAEVFYKDWLKDEVPNMFGNAYPSPTTFPSETLYPNFLVEHMVTYCSLFLGNTEVFRKKVTRREYDHENHILHTIVNIPPLEANIRFDSIGWFAGTKATIDFGTGVLIDKQPTNIRKTNKIAMQIDRTDRKGW